MAETQKRILAVIPCYNEAGSIAALLDEFAPLSDLCDTLVIDDGSRDDSYAIASARSPVLRFDRNRGLSAVLHEGICYAAAHGYELCVQIDADGQHIPANILPLVEAYERSGASLLLGSRYLQDRCNLTPRRLAGVLISLLLYLRFSRQWIHDPTSGMRMMDRHAIAYFSTHLDPGRCDAVIIAQAMKAGLRIQEVPVTMRARKSGLSHLSGWRGLRFLLRVLWQMIRLR